MGLLAIADELIREALRTRLWSVSGVPGTSLRALENTTIKPPSSSTWIRESTQFDATEGTGLGMSAGIPVRHHLTGAYMVDLFYPYGQGTGPSGIVVGNIGEAFKPGTTLTNGGISVLIERYSKSGQQDGDGWYFRPLVISWSCDVVQ